MGNTPSKENIFGLSKEDHLLYSPTLLDLDHGTIRHRDKELVEEDMEVKQGYFYHAQLTDWTDDSSIKDFQKKVVVKRSEKDNKMFYVYGTGLEGDTEDRGLVKVKAKPKGLGYRWRGRSEHRYFRLRFSKIRDEEESESEAEELQGYETVYRLHPKTGMTAGDISQFLSLKLVLPANRIHIIYKMGKIQYNSLIDSLSIHYSKCKIELKIMTDVEIVKFNYDAEEFEQQNLKLENETILEKIENASDTTQDKIKKLCVEHEHG